MGLVRYFAAFLFIIAVPVALVTTTVRVVVNEPRLYEYATDNYDTPETTGIAREQLLRASDELLEYFNNDEEEIFIRVQKDGQPIRLFNDRETAHLRDVKTLFQFTFRVQEASVIFVLAYVVAVFIWAREGSLRTLARQVLLSGLASLAVIGVVGVIAVSGFHQAWDQFHQIAFSFTDNPWQFNTARDHLIQMFPEAFWQDTSLWVGTAIIVELAALALLSAAYLRLTRPSPAQHTPPQGS
ncbi:MAG: TIGR01906 family membrane protein [Chloroflexi bacterium]|nr:TIGR01906 family membrane protein [Chloroflexota bacterium]